MRKSSGEAQLQEPLVEWLRQRRRVRHDTIILSEFAWFGRRIDLVTLTCSGTVTAFELKLNNNRRAIQQAAYNKIVFDRSYVVTLTDPTEAILKQARDVGVGFIVLKNDSVKMVQESATAPVPGTLRRRLLRTVRRKRELNV